MPRLTSNAVQSSLLAGSLVRPQSSVSISTESVPMLVMVRQADGSAAVRPWMTVAIDNVSRMPIAVHVHLEEPSDEVAQQCLEKAVLHTTQSSHRSRGKQIEKRRGVSVKFLTPTPPKVPRPTF